MKPEALPYARQTVSQADIDCVDEVLKSDWLTQGPKVSEFEKELCKISGAKYCTAVSNGTAALYIACRALGVNEKDVGLTSSLSFAASANCIALCGATPDFLDIAPDTLCITSEGLNSYCRNNERVRVIIPVDFAGIPADLPAIHEAASSHRIHVIEDAAHALGSTYYHQNTKYSCGSCAHSDLAIFSFHPVKNITSGEGGAILTNNKALAEKVGRLANHGIERNPENFQLEPVGTNWGYELQELSLNFRLSDIHAALGLSQLARLAEFKAKRSSLVALYSSLLAELIDEDIIRIPTAPSNCSPCYHLYTMYLTSASKVSRQTLFDELRKRSIYPQIHYWPIHLQPYYQKTYGYQRGMLPVTEQIASNCLSLPLFPDMTESDVHRVADDVRDILFVNGNGKR